MLCICEYVIKYQCAYLCCANILGTDAHFKMLQRLQKQHRISEKAQEKASGCLYINGLSWVASAPPHFALHCCVVYAPPYTLTSQRRREQELEDWDQELQSNNSLIDAAQTLGFKVKEIDPGCLYSWWRVLPGGMSKVIGRACLCCWASVIITLNSDTR